MKTVLRISIVFLGVILISCHKEKDPEYVYLSSFTKDHFYFKKGSYWIYKDSISGIVDSFFLKNSAINFNSSEVDLNNIIGEVLNLEIIQVSNDTNKKDLIQWLYTITNNSLTASYRKNNVEYSVVRGHFYEDYTSFVPYKTGHTKFYSGRVGDVSINFNLFPNVWTILFEDSFASNKSLYQQTSYFYNDSVGFLKKKLDYRDLSFSINEVWELQRWSVIK